MEAVALSAGARVRRAEQDPGPVVVDGAAAEPVTGDAVGRAHAAGEEARRCQRGQVGGREGEARRGEVRLRHCREDSRRGGGSGRREVRVPGRGGWRASCSHAGDDGGGSMCGEEDRWLPVLTNIGGGATPAHALPRPLQRLVISQDTRSARHAAARRPAAAGRGHHAGGHVHRRQVLLLQGLRHRRPREPPQARVR